MPTPIHIHPLNPKCFEFRGEPRMLVTATEHYGAVMNRPFRFERYLADAAGNHITLTRLFGLFRELQAPRNPYSTCKPESPDYVAPFARTGPGTALDGQPLFDLDQWNPEFFERLHGFLSLASHHGIVVEIVLLSNTYESRIWQLNPLHARNNVNALPEIPWSDYTTMRHGAVFDRQKAYVRKMVEETNRYDNIFYEICNEPGGGLPGVEGAPTPAEVDAWQAELADVIRETEAGLTYQHLIAGHQAFTYAPWEHPAQQSFQSFFVDVVNMHPLPGITYRGTTYDMGVFMAKQLRVRALRDFCLATYHEKKPLNLDEDNAATQYKDPEGWTIHRKRAWTALISGAHYDCIDFSIINYCETGTDASREHLRTWMRHLSQFIHSIDLVRARPLTEWVTDQPEHTCASVMGIASKDYCVYLADERERDDPAAGEPIWGDIAFALPEGPYRVATFSPVTGAYSAWRPISGGGDTRITLPRFRHDIVARITRA